jgi:hypothetical protein
MHGLTVRPTTIGEKIMTTTHKAKRSIYVEAREWFDKANGNSYYSARVWVDGNHVFTTGQQYGYDFAYESHVTVDLISLGYLPGSLGEGRNIRWAKDLGLDVYTVKYDARKRDLWKADYPKTDAELGAEIVGRKLAQILN